MNGLSFAVAARESDGDSIEVRMDAKAQTEEIISFWFDDVGPEGWYGGGEELDDEIRRRYGELTENARTGGLDGWTCAARPVLALIILLDQFPRNLYRGDPRSFASDAKGRAVAGRAIGRGFDLRHEPPARNFFYLPFMHSEMLSDQHRAVRLFKLNVEGADGLAHARAHREIIRRFGRFPYRNAALGRTSTAAEAEFLEGGGYRAMLAEIRD